MLEINKREDIIIPFERVGDDGWEKRTRQIIQSLNNNWSSDHCKPVSQKEIEMLEARLGTTLPHGLKVFYQTFGLADIGEKLQSFDEMGWIVDIWKESPEYSPDFSVEDKKELPYLVTFSGYTGNGNMFCFHSKTKEIFYYDHEERPYLSRIFYEVDDYLKGSLIFAQVDLFGNNTDQATVEEWAEDIVAGIYGANVVEKWRY